MFWRKILKFEIIFLVAGVLLIFTMPILALEINEKNIKTEDYLVIKSGLPENQILVWSGSLPEIKERIKVKKIIIDLSEQKLKAYENDELVGDFLVSTGRSGMATPVGDFRIEYKNIRKWSATYGLWMPYWMLIDSRRAIGIHELPEWPGGYKEGINHLGMPVSHGCIRLGVGPAEFIYNWAEIGTQVEVVE